jgi:hypothetical protein
MKKRNVRRLSPGCLTFAVAFCLLVCTAYAQDLRLIGTKLYDFSGISAAGNNNSPYAVSGTVLAVDDARIHLRRITVRYELGADALNESPEGLLLALAALKMAQSGITAGQMLSLSPRMRQAVLGLHKIETVYDATLLNYPNPCTVDQELRACALPIPGKSSAFDYGKPVALADATNYPAIYHVHANSIEDQPMADFIAGQQTDAHKTFVRRCSQAAEGRLYPQVLLGFDYWYGRGTPTNHELALHWLGIAAEAGAKEAKDFLRTNSPPAK